VTNTSKTLWGHYIFCILEVRHFLIDCQEAVRRKPKDFCSSECLLTNIIGSLCLESSCKCWLTCDISTLWLPASIHCHGWHMFLFVLVSSFWFMLCVIVDICCCLFWPPASVTSVTGRNILFRFVSGLSFHIAWHHGIVPVGFQLFLL